ncbi:MAG: PEP-CTERM sorting domain-containing protein [Fimbriimonadaceae bacterium]|nr:PEP-CTERM sorting domain-containing protein [Fimbriimonadaceae bacterium]QYK58320.1 MAG: PEP-CTERM sorting domain-containing protein [Fimbriimonadaceae bacterium]
MLIKPITTLSLLTLAASLTLAQGSGIGSNGIVGTTDPNNFYNVVGSSLVASDFNSPSTWKNAIVCDDMFWGIKNHTGSIAGRSWINRTGNSQTIDNLLIATSFNPGNTTSVNITVRFGVDDRLSGVYVNGIGNAFTPPLGNHTTPTTFTWNNVAVNANTMNWLYFHQRDIAQVASGFIYDAQIVPEPATMLALGTAAAALIARRRRRTV